MRTLHHAITPIIMDALAKKLSVEVKFENEYRAWLESQGWNFGWETHQHVASMASHLLINKLLFYKLLETNNPSVRPLKEIDPSTQDLTRELKRYFDFIVSKIDYKAVYRDTFYDNIPIPNEILELLSNFVEELSLTDLKQTKSDVIGTMYERLVTKEERKALGQFYTPPQIIEFIVRLCVTKADDRVLDPCCGSGGFLVKAYHRLLDLKRGENPFVDSKSAHSEVLKQIEGIEINQFPAHLSTINLAIQNVESLTNTVQIETTDFFK